MPGRTPSYRDYTCKLGQLGGLCDWPMYSFTRPASLFWNAFANHLRRCGMKDGEIKRVLQSKHTRWLLDDEGAFLEEVGRYLALRYFRDYRESYGPIES